MSPRLARRGSGRVLLSVAALAVLLAAGCDVDLSKGYPYACTRDAGASACPGGWRCSLEGVCVDPAIAAPLRCQTEADCGGGWHCGVEGRCYDRADAGEALCRADAGDCAEGWRCGLNGHCHDQSVGAAYACAADPDCEQGWRCGPNQACVDSTRDALRAPPEPSQLSLRRLSPVFDALPSQVAVSRIRDYTFPDGLVSSGFSAAMVFDGGVWLVQRYYGGLDRSPHASWVPGVQSPSAIVAEGPMAYGVDALGLWRYQAGDAGVDRLPAPLLDHPALRMGDDSNRSEPLLALFDRSAFTLFDPALGTAFQPTQVPRPDGGFAPLLDVAHANVPGVGEVLLLATEDGLFQVPGASGFFDADGGFGSSVVPVELSTLPNAQCSGPPAWLPVRIAVSDLVGGYPSPVSAAYAVEVVPADDAGARPRLMVFGQNAAASASCGDLGLPSSGPIDPCADAGTLVGFSWTNGYAYYYFDTWRTGTYLLSRCRPDSPGADVLQVDVIDQSSGPISRGSSGYYGYSPRDTQALLAPSSRHGEYLDARGNAHGYSGGLYYSNLFPGVSSRAFGSLDTTLQLSTQDGLAQWDPTAGMVLVPGNPQCAGVEGLPQWAMSCELSNTEQPGLQLVAWAAPGAPRVVDLSLTYLLDGDQYGAAPLTARTGDGGVVVAVALEDTIWAGDVTRLLPLDAGVPLDGGIGLLEPRLAPKPRNPIDALTFTGPDPANGARLTSGYALVGGGLFQIRAQDPVLWRSSEIDLPAPDPVGLWSDGPRGRLLYADGTVYALPSRVRIADPLPAGAYDEFATLCGHAYAVSGGVLYQLAPADAGTVGQWRPIDLSPAYPRFVSDPGMSSPRLFSTGSELLLSSDYGEVYRLSAPCDADGGLR